MIKMLASVNEVSEALLVQKEGVDILDLKNPHKGALGALNMNLVNEIVVAVNGVTTISSTIGDMAFKASLIKTPVEEMILAGVDIVKIGVFSPLLEIQKAEHELLKQFGSNGTRIVLVLFAEHYQADFDLKRLAETGVYGVMIDTINKTNGSLLDKLSMPILNDFVQEAKSLGLHTGLAGSLKLGNFSPLMSLEPDYLGFRGGICSKENRREKISAEAVREIRNRIQEQSVDLHTSKTAINML